MRQAPPIPFEVEYICPDCGGNGITQTCMGFFRLDGRWVPNNNYAHCTDESGRRESGCGWTGRSYEADGTPRDLWPDRLYSLFNYPPDLSMENVAWEERLAVTVLLPKSFVNVTFLGEGKEPEPFQFRPYVSGWTFFEPLADDLQEVATSLLDRIKQKALGGVE